MRTGDEDWQEDGSSDEWEGATNAKRDQLTGQPLLPLQLPLFRPPANSLISSDNGHRDFRTNGNQGPLPSGLDPLIDGTRRRSSGDCSGRLFPVLLLGASSGSPAWLSDDWRHFVGDDVDNDGEELKSSRQACRPLLCNLI